MRFSPLRRQFVAVTWGSSLALFGFSAKPAHALDLSRLKPPVVGSGQVAEEGRSVDSSERLKLSTGARVVLRQGERFSVSVVAEDNVRPLISTYVENGILIVEDEKRFKSSSAEVIITIRGLSSLETTGDVAVEADRLRLPSLSLNMGGESAVSLRDVSVARLNAALGDSSVLKASGTADNSSFQLGGKSAVQASRLETKSVSVAGGGSAQATVWASEALRVALGGSAGVSYYGNLRPTQSISGAATVSHRGPVPPNE
jgi:Putative auto-transporter adhesin, head GIN domain